MNKWIRGGLSFLTFLTVYVLMGLLINREEGFVRILVSGMIADVVFHLLSHLVRKRLERKKNAEE